MGIHGSLAGLRESILRDGGGIAAVRQLQPLVDKGHAAGSVDAAALGFNEELQFPPPGVHFALVLADEAVQNRLGGLLCHLRPVFRALALAQCFQVGGTCLGQQRVLQQRQLPGPVGDDVVHDVVKQQQVLYIGVAGGVVIVFRMADEGVGKLVFRLAHHRGALAEHLAAVCDECILYIAQALRHGAHHLRLALLQLLHLSLFLPLVVDGGENQFFLADLIQ